MSALPARMPQPGQGDDLQHMLICLYFLRDKARIPEEAGFVFVVRNYFFFGLHIAPGIERLA